MSAIGKPSSRVSLVLMLLVAPLVVAQDEEAEAHGLFATGLADEPQELPLRHTAVSVEISGFVARTRVEQTFDNPFDEPIEVLYRFPLGDNAAVDFFEMQIGTRVVRGEIRPREEARRVYEEAREQGFRAALLDQERPDVFRQRIANVLPGETLIVRIQTVEMLLPHSGAYEYAFPLVVASRYASDGAPGVAEPPPIPYDDTDDDVTEPEEARRAPGVSLELWLDAGVPIVDVTSPTYGIRIARGKPSTALVVLERDVEVPDRDFALRWRVGAKEPALGALAHRDGGDGYFAFLLQPQGEIALEDSTPKHVIFLIDVSGSMSGGRLDAAKAFVARALERLRVEDKFSLVKFESRPDAWRGSPALAGASEIQHAQEWIENLESEGGTELLRGLEAAAELARTEDRFSMIVAITDALVSGDDEILGALPDLLGETRLFVAGMGLAPNRSLVRRMAQVGRGGVVFIPDKQGSKEALEKFFDWAGRPYLTDLTIDWGALPVLDTLPEMIPDLFHGQALGIVGRYVGSGAGEVTVRGRRSGVAWEQSLHVELPEHAEEHAALGTVWARRRIDELTPFGREPDEDVRAEIVELAVEHGILTDFTSFVAVDYASVADPEGTPAAIEQAVPTPADERTVGLGMERVRVEAQSAMVELAQTASTAYFSDQFVQDLPRSGRFYQNILTLAPGVQDPDGDGPPTVHGSRSRDFRAVVSGVRVDPRAGYSMSQINRDTIEQVDVVTAGAGVEFGRAQGGFARVVQKQGTNETEGAFTTSLHPRLDEPGASAREPEYDGQQAEFSLGGPMVEDRLWYHVSLAGVDREDLVETRGTLDLTETQGWSHSERLTWQVSPRNKLQLHLDGSSLERDKLDVSSMVRDGAASALEERRQAYVLEWIHPHSPKLLLEARVAYDTVDAERDASTGESTCSFGSISGQCFDSVSGLELGSIARPYSDRRSALRLGGDAAFFAGRFAGGQHELRFGVELESMDYGRTVELRPDLLLDVPVGSAAAHYGRFAHGSARSDGSQATTWSIHAEDLYRPHDRVSITLGLRVDRRSIDAPGRAPFDPAAESAAFRELVVGLGPDERRALAAVTFTGYEEIESLVTALEATLGADLTCFGACEGFAARGRAAARLRLEETDLTPMVAVSWDPRGQGKDRLAFTARRYYGEVPEELPLLALEPATADLQMLASDSGLAAGSTVVAPNVLVVDPGLRAPAHDEWTLGTTHEVATETALSLRFVHRRFQRQPRYFHLNYRRLEDGSDELLNPYWGDVVELRATGRAEHEALVVELTRREYRSWELHGSYTLSWTRGDGEGFDAWYAGEAGQLAQAWGAQSNDRRHVFVVSGGWLSPWGVRVGGVATWQSGLPYSELLRDVTPAALAPELEGIVEATPRRTLLYDGERNGHRNGSVLEVDLCLEKELSAGRGVNVRLTADVLNIFGTHAWVVYSPLREVGRTIGGAEDGRHVPGRRYVLGLRLVF